MSLDTWISLAVLVTALSGFYVALRRELRAEINGLRSEVGSARAELRAEIREEGARLEGLILRLDDRIYALAAGVQPVPDGQSP